MQGIASILDSEPDIEVVGEAADGQQAADLCGEAEPDIILIDIRETLFVTEATGKTHVSRPRQAEPAWPRPTCRSRL